MRLMDFKKTPPICDFEELRKKMVALMKSRDYSWHSLDRYRQILNRLEKYLTEKNTSFYSREMGTGFLAECKQYRGNYQGKKPGQTDNARTTVHILDSIMEQGDFARIKQEPKYICPNFFKDEFEKYLDSQQSSGKMAITVQQIQNGCAQFLVALEEMGVKSLDEINPQNIYSSLAKYSSRVVFGLYVRPFLRYLHTQGILKADYSKLLPSFRADTLIPTVYEKEEIESLLSAIDTTGAFGKRNYAMILLAARLGMRSSDISSLKFDEIDFSQKKIAFVQMKTKTPIKFPLFDEIDTAISDYIKVRPCNTVDNNIFLRSKAPYFPLGAIGVTSMVRKYLKIANINTKGKKCGTHSLRSSLASSLVSENVPYSVAQKILGHNDSNAIKHYVRLDIEHLRECALSVPPPTGNFSELLGMKEVRL